MNRQLTQRIALDRTTWHAIRCGLGLHVKARYELHDYVMTRKEGRKVIEFTVLMNVQEAICCGKVLDLERVGVKLRKRIKELFGFAKKSQPSYPIETEDIEPHYMPKNGTPYKDLVTQENMRDIDALGRDIGKAPLNPQDMDEVEFTQDSFTLPSDLETPESKKAIDSLTKRD